MVRVADSSDRGRGGVCRPGRLVLWAGLLAGGSLLAACDFARAPAVSCGAPLLGERVADDIVAQSNASPTDPVTIPTGGMFATEAQTEDRVVETIRERVIAGRAPGEPAVLRVLVLSAGGQYGAYGAGFLTGWSQNPNAPRPEFDLITGVSAGAILAPVAQAGAQFDDTLAFWRGLSNDQVFVRRNPLALLRSPAVTDPTPLRLQISEEIDAPFLDAIAKRERADARTLISAVNLETTRAQIFDLGMLAASDLPFEVKNACMTEAILASAAVPGLFPPRNIDGGLYADGGLRDQLFLVPIEQARDRIARETGREVRVDVRVVLNGSLDPPAGALNDNLPGYFLRSTLILGDEVLRNSVRRVIDFAQSRDGWTISGIVGRVDLSGCTDEDDEIFNAFDSCTTRTLFNQGQEDGQIVPIPWLDAETLAALAQSPGAGSE